MTTKRTRWPLTGGIPCQLSSAEVSSNQRIYIGGYQDGSVRIWDATFPVLSLIFVLGFEVSVVLQAVKFCICDLNQLSSSLIILINSSLISNNIYPSQTL